MTRPLATIAPLAALLVLGACGQKAPAPDRGAKGTAQGEVLGGSIDDSMLPLDTVRSQSPLQPAQAADNASGDEDSTATDAAPAASEPAAEPTPEETAKPSPTPNAKPSAKPSAKATP
jgi:hypothetical protein